MRPINELHADLLVSNFEISSISAARTSFRRSSRTYILEFKYRSSSVSQWRTSFSISTSSTVQFIVPAIDSAIRYTFIYIYQPHAKGRGMAAQYSYLGCAFDRGAKRRSSLEIIFRRELREESPRYFPRAAEKRRRRRLEDGIDMHAGRDNRRENEALARQARGFHIPRSGARSVYDIYTERISQRVYYTR